MRTQRERETVRERKEREKGRRRFFADNEKKVLYFMILTIYFLYIFVYYASLSFGAVRVSN